MMRTQDRLGVESWFAGAAQNRQLSIPFYGTSDQSIEKTIVSAMDGHNYGPVVRCS